MEIAGGLQPILPEDAHRWQAWLLWVWLGWWLETSLPFLKSCSDACYTSLGEVAGLKLSNRNAAPLLSSVALVWEGRLGLKHLIISHV